MRNAGVRPIADGQTGLLVPTNEPVAMAEALFYMLEHHEERQTKGAAGRNLVMRDFSAANMISETERLLTEIVAGL